MSKEDRKAKKFLPFDALEGYKKALKNKELEQMKREKPFLSDDQMEEINTNLHLCLKEFHQIKLIYYNQGFLKNAFGVIKEVNQIEKYLLINNVKILFCDIVELKII